MKDNAKAERILKKIQEHVGGIYRISKFIAYQKEVSLISS